MLRRLTLLTLLLALLASAKTYTLSLSSAAQAGDAQLQAGEYSLRIHGSQAVLTNAEGQELNVRVWVQISVRKFEQTAVVFSQLESNRIESIEIGGSRNKIVFR